MTTVDIYGPTLDARIYPSDAGGHESWAPEWNIHDDLLRITTDKTMAQPAGTFSIGLTARRDSQNRTWAQRIRPMDYVEIYMGRGKPKGVQSDIVMRGFVDRVDETDEVSGNSVMRSINIQGRDYGKRLLKAGIVFLTEIDPTVATLGPQYSVGFHLGDTAGVAAFMTPSDFWGRVRDYLLTDPTIGSTARNPRVPAIHSFTDLPDFHAITFFNLSSQSGSIWAFLQQWEGKPWNEMFIRDDDDFPRLYWRQAPLKGRDGKILPHGDRMVPTQASGDATNYKTHELSLRQVIRPYVGTSDDEAFCYFFSYPLYAEQLADLVGFVYPPGGSPGITQQLGNLAKQGTAIGGNPILRPDIFARYGFQAMKVQYPMLPLPKSDSKTDSLPIVEEVVRLTRWMHNAFSHNPALESGTLLCRGLPEIRIGNYALIKEQQREFYVEGVHHNFQIWPKPQFQTSLDVTRGLWLENNPYPEMGWL